MAVCPSVATGNPGLPAPSPGVWSCPETFWQQTDCGSDDEKSIDFIDYAE